jgi:DNA-binding NarL/FixJ family response regulator
MQRTKAPLAGKNVLIAEDDPLVSMEYAATLSSAGATIVATARTPDEAITHVHRGVDVAVIDFVLADRNSSDLQAKLKQEGIPFVVVSGYPTVLVRGSGDQQVLNKPFDADLPCRAVAAACTGKC